MSLVGERVGIDGEAVIVRCDLDPVRHLVQNRVVRAAVPEFELVGLAAQRQTENLLAEADAEDRFLADQLANLGGLELERFGIARAVRQEDAVGVQREDVLGGCAGRYDSDVGAHVARRRRMLRLIPKSYATT